MMKHSINLALAATLVGVLSAQDPNQPPTLPPNHPTSKSADNKPIEANPADVQSIEAIVSAYYDVISGKAGEPRDWDRFQSLFLSEARFLTSKAVGKRYVPIVLTPLQFMDSQKKYFERGGYFEHEISKKVDQFGNIAQVFSTYEARHKIDEVKPYSRGINSIQLLNTGTRWWIVTVMWDFERPDDSPIPSQYLNQDASDPQ